ncbi:hypothetical protein ES319_A05G244500v1 [Gossypium barbadense]|uniref:Aldehyde dehydrogenase domain-containing protein n=1 Tax=Gossypium barbadense TaxID=3634 RepID=A0A5J5VTW8_GOSBA|nr:hypothetical protein ES319_A05G244500v1 [Gossypium barbadense]
MTLFVPLLSVVSLDPVVGAISAGNAIVLKPSEMAPASSSLLAKLVADYLDSSCIKVVEGAVPETSALLEQKWDKILYTGPLLIYNHLPSPLTESFMS